MVIIHDDEVGLFPWFERTQAVVDIQKLRGIQRRHPNRLNDRYVQRID